MKFRLETRLLGNVFIKKNLEIPQGGNQNMYIKEEETTQWTKKKYKRTKNDLQNIHIKLKIG
jgi:hypothetical protein